jgi:hypothetical protein
MKAQVTDRPWGDFGIPLVPVPDLPIFKASPATMYPDGPQVLCSLIAHYRPQRYFELGTGPGLSLDIVKHYIPMGRAWSLDIFPPTHYRPAGMKLVEGVNYIQHDSHTWLPPADMLYSMDATFVDADHSLASVAADTQKALLLTKPDGILVWHDVCLVDKELTIWDYLNFYFYHMPIKWPEGSRIAWVDMREVKRG